MSYCVPLTPQLPAAYPFKAPDIMLMTPNGRFELNKKVCLTITGFHEESWQPAWGIRTALVGLTSFFQTEAKGAIGGLDTSPSERKRLAALSKNWTCPTCQMRNIEILPPSEKKEQQEEDAAGSTQESQDGDTSKAAGPEGGELRATKNDDSATASTPTHLSGPTTEKGNDAATSIPSQVSSSEAEPARPVPSASIHAQGPLSAASAPPSSSSPSTSAQDGSRIARSATNPRESSREHAQQVQVVNLLASQRSLGGGSEGSAPAPHVRFASPSPTSTSGSSTQHRDGAEGNDDLSAALLTATTVPPSKPPLWLDGAIGCVTVAILSLLCRKML